jgi:hypothetical protein
MRCPLLLLCQLEFAGLPTDPQARTTGSHCKVRMPERNCASDGLKWTQAGHATPRLEWDTKWEAGGRLVYKTSGLQVVDANDAIQVGRPWELFFRD